MVTAAATQCRRGDQDFFDHASIYDASCGEWSTEVSDWQQERSRAARASPYPWG
jgi:hypothetical protein